jgi:hypothetical protein
MIREQRKFFEDEFSWIRKEYQAKTRYFRDYDFKIIGVGK